MKSLLKEYGFSDAEIQKKIDDAWFTIFDEASEDAFYHNDKDAGYMFDTGNYDARTEGMSYGMLMAVEMDKKDIFDRLWKWSMDFMFMNDGYMKGYFGWSVDPKTKKKAMGPAPDGEEFYALALIFASKRWGDGNGIFNYSLQAKKLLSTMIHHNVPMWNLENKLVLFVPGFEFSDPSYHLPHFYEIYAENCEKEDVQFWKDAAKASREYLKKSCHPKTGMAAEYADFDGSPRYFGPPDGHGFFYSDSYRVVANIGLDALWGTKDEDLIKRAAALQAFFKDINPTDYMTYKTDGVLIEHKALHPVGLLATLAQGSLASSLSDDETARENAKYFVNLFWNTPLRKGERRYYDNCLYFFALLALSGNYRPF